MAVHFVSLGTGMALLLFASGVAWAQESEPKENSRVRAQLDSTIYAEFGDVYSGFGDESEDYHEQAAGLGVLGTLRFGTSDMSAPSGALLLLGVTQELSALQLFQCGEFCSVRATSDSTTAARAGIGWDFRWVGLRAGAITRSDRDFPHGVSLIPDVALRVGPLDQFNVTLGIGAYDAQTTTRPGLYLGFGTQPTPRFSAAVHAGVHYALDDLTLRSDITCNYRLTTSLSLGFGVAVQGLGPESALQGHLSLGVQF